MQKLRGRRWRGKLEGVVDMLWDSQWMILLLLRVLRVLLVRHCRGGLRYTLCFWGEGE